MRLASLVLAGTLLGLWPASGQTQAKPYVFADVKTLLESGLTPARIAVRLEGTCFQGDLGVSQLATLERLGATPALLQALRVRACPRGASSSVAAAPAQAPPVPPPSPSTAAPVSAALLPLTLSPAALVMEQGATGELRATVRSGSSATTPAVPLTWLSTDDAIVTVIGGRLTAVGPGEAVVVVRGTGLQAATTTVRVTTGVASRVALSLDKPTLRVGETQLVNAAAVTTGGLLLSTSDATCAVNSSCVTYAISDSTIARLERSGDTRRLRALRPGQVVVSARLAGGTCLGGTAVLPARVANVACAEATVRVEAPGIARIDVVPDTVTLQPGERRTLRWSALGTDGLIEPGWLGAPVWTASDENLVLVQDGVVTALREGVATVVAAVNGVRSRPARILIRRVLRVARLEASHDTVRFTVGERGRVTIRAVSANGTAMRAGPVTFTVSDPQRLQTSAVPSADTLVTAELSLSASTAGTYTVTAVSGDVSSRSIAVVVSPALARLARLVAGEGRVVVGVDSTRTVSVLAVGTDERPMQVPMLGWQSSAPDVCLVREEPTSADGMTRRATIVPRRAGSGTVYVATPTGEALTIDVQIKGPVATPPVLLRYSSGTLRLYVGQTDSLSVTAFRGSDGTSYTGRWSARWTSDDSAIASVAGEAPNRSTAKAMVHGVAAGRSEITVETDAGARASFTVEVLAPSDPSSSTKTTSAPTASSGAGGGTGPTVLEYRTFADSLVHLIEERDSAVLSQLLSQSPPAPLRGFFRVLREIQGVPTVSVMTVLTGGSDLGDAVATVRIMWRGSFGGEMKFVRFALTIGADGRRSARVLP